MKTIAMVLACLFAACKGERADAVSNKDLEDFCSTLTSRVEEAARSYRAFASTNGGASMENDESHGALKGLELGVTSSERAVGGKLLGEEVRLCLHTAGGKREGLQAEASRALSAFVLAADSDKVAKAMEDLAAILGKLPATGRQ